MRVAEDLGRGFVDQANLVGRIDDQQALAQVLHDVLGEVREIGEIEVFLADQILALAHARREHARGGRDGEEDQSQKAGGRVRGDIERGR